MEHISYREECMSVEHIVAMAAVNHMAQAVLRVLNMI